MKTLTWDELANFYDKKTGGRARIQPMKTIFEWAIKQPEIEENKDGTLTFKLTESEVK